MCTVFCKPLRLKVVLRTEYSKEYSRGRYWGGGGKGAGVPRGPWLFDLAVAICSFVLKMSKILDSINM